MALEVTGAVALPDDRCLLLSDTACHVLDPLSGTLGDATCSVAQEFVGTWDGGRIVPVYWGCGQVFLFRDGEFTRCDLATRRVVGDAPRLVAGNWPGLWEDGPDAGFNALNGKAYFFKGGEYLRYDIALDRTDAGYPRPISEAWSGVWPEGMDAALCPDGLRAVFFRGPDCAVYDLLEDRVTAGPMPAETLRLDPLPSGMVRPARELTPAQANGILRHLVDRAQLSLRVGAELPPAGQRIAVAPAELAGVRFVNAAAHGADVIDNLDQRMAVALWRLARWANASSEDVHAILHLGIGHGGGPADDCHNCGRAIDLSGLQGERDGAAFALDVQRDWGSRPSGDPAAYRLTEDDEPARSLFRRVFAFGAHECESRGHGREAWPPLEIGQAGFVIYPDYYGAGRPDALALRRAHSNHVHMQIGPTRGAY